MASCAVTEQLTVKDDEEEKKKKISRAASASFREPPKRTTQHRFLEGMIQTAEAAVRWSQLNCEPR